MDLVGHIPVSNLPMSEAFQLIQLTAEHCDELAHILCIKCLEFANIDVFVDEL